MSARIKKTFLVFLKDDVQSDDLAETNFLPIVIKGMESELDSMLNRFVILWSNDLGHNAHLCLAFVAAELDWVCFEVNLAAVYLKKLDIIGPFAVPIIDEDPGGCESLFRLLYHGAWACQALGLKI